MIVLRFNPTDKEDFMDRLDGKSMNIINDNIEKLKQIFPEVFS